MASPKCVHAPATSRHALRAGRRYRGSSPSTAASRGFTLLELIIAITLTGLIMLLAFSAMRLAISSWRTVESVDASLEELQVVQGFLRRQLEQARSVTRTNQTEQNTTLKGNVRALNFIAPMPGSRLGVWGLYRFSLAFVPVDSGTNLQITYTLALPPADPGQISGETQTRILLRNLEAGAFSYFGTLTVKEPATWHDEWTSDASLPQLVRVRLRSQGQGKLLAGPDHTCPCAGR